MGAEAVAAVGVAAEAAAAVKWAAVTTADRADVSNTTALLYLNF